MSSLLRRTGALAASVVLLGAGLAVAAAPAQAVGTDPRPVSVGASWLADHLVNGVIKDNYIDSFTDPNNPVPVEYDDLGLTMDTAMSLVAVGAHASTVATIKTAMDARITETYDSFGTIYTGSAAKAAVYDRLVGGDPKNVNGTDLVKVVEDNTSATAPTVGKIQNVNDSFGDSNTFGQAFAVRALAEAGSTKAADAEAFLLKQQCADGFFRLNPAAPAALDQTCQATNGTDASAPDNDATSIALIQLESLATKSDAVKASIQAGRQWLLDEQLPDGSFGGGPSTSAANANSTGLAGIALAGTGDAAAAKAAAIWVRSLQADEVGTCTSKLSTQTGGIGYDAGTVAAGRANGITFATKDRWLRTTAPVLPVLKYAPASTPNLNVLGPTSTVKGGSVVVYRITGVVPGDKVCVYGLGRHKVVTGGAGGRARVAFTMPNGTGSRTIVVSDRGGNSASIRTEILGPKKLTVTAQSQIQRGKVLPVTVTGLAPGEPVRVAWRGTTVRRGYADLHGVFRTSFGVGTTLGNGAVSAFGKWADIRKGYDVVKVVA